ncbi:putative glucan 1,3-beta-glucosidase [Helianthus annuus]|nr:putative glucan 1,3-beta-glucosidase [Helianthus annuus]
MRRINDAVKRILRVKFTMGLFENPLADYSYAKYLGCQLPGSHADNLGYQCGGWTLQWQGVSGNNLTAGTTILSAIKTAVDPRTQVVYNENPDDKYMKSNKFDYAIVVVGEYPYAEFLGDSSNLTIPEPDQPPSTGSCGSVKCVVVLITGRPVVVQPYVRNHRCPCGCLASRNRGSRCHGCFVW